MSFEVITDALTGEQTIRPYTPEEIAALEAAALAAAVPKVVSRKQVRLLLLNQGLLDQVEALIATRDKATQIEWQDSLEFHRDNPLLNALAQNIGLSSEQIDQFFIDASAL